MVTKCGICWVVSVESIGESIAAPSADRVFVPIVIESSGLALISFEFGVIVHSNLPVEILDHESQTGFRSLASARDGDDNTLVTSFFPVTVILLTNALLNVAVLIVASVEASNVRINVGGERSGGIVTLFDGGFAVEAESTVSDSWVRIDSFSFSGVRFSVRSSVASIPASVIVVRVGSVVVVVVIISVIVVVVVVFVLLILFLLFLVSKFIDVLVEVIFVGVVCPCDRI